METKELEQLKSKLYFLNESAGILFLSRKDYEYKIWGETVLEQLEVLKKDIKKHLKNKY